MASGIIGTVVGVLFEDGNKALFNVYEVINPLDQTREEQIRPSNLAVCSVEQWRDAAAYLVETRRVLPPQITDSVLATEGIVWPWFDGDINNIEDTVEAEMLDEDVTEVVKQ